MNSYDDPPAYYANLYDDPFAFYAKAVTFHSAIVNGSLQIDDIQKLKFQTEVTKHINGHIMITQQCVIDDIQRLANAVLSIETYFASINSGLKIFDERLVVDQMGYYKFAPTWKVLHDEYTSLMMSSKTTANKVSDKITDFLFIVENNNLTTSVKLKFIYQYIESLEKLPAEGKENAERFARLRENVNDFSKHVKKIFENQVGDIETKVGELDKKITELQDKLKRVSNPFWATLDVLSLASPGIMSAAHPLRLSLETVVLVGGLGTLSTLVPPVGITILAIGCVVFGLCISNGIKQHVKKIEADMNKFATSQNKRTARQNERDAAAIRDHQLREVLDIMSTLDSDFEQMIPQLSSIHGIWDTLVADAQNLHRLLSSLNTADNAQVFQTTLEGVKVTYEMLKLAVDNYSLGVA